MPAQPAPADNLARARQPPHSTLTDGSPSGQRFPPPRIGAGTNSGTAGHVLALVRQSEGLTRAEIIEQTGLARATVGNRLDALQSAGYISPGSPATASRGRPPSEFKFRPNGGVLLIAEAGATGARLALTDLAGSILHETRSSLEITIGPRDWLANVESMFDALLTEANQKPNQVKGIGLSLPGPVDFERGVVVSPPIMTGWDEYPIRSWFAGRFDCPVLIENDANAMTVGEHRASYANNSSLVMLKLATGIGAGIITDGRIYRGADGAAGDIGHIQITPPDSTEPPLCRCGNRGCIEAYASGWALIRDLNAEGRTVGSVTQVVDLIKTGDPLATAMSRRAGRLIGIALSDAVSLLNPGIVVIGGELSAAANDLFAGIRESVYARSLPLATRRLEIVPARLGAGAGVSGLTATVTDYIFNPARIDAILNRAAGYAFVRAY